jgi:hypothetical protein
VLCSAVLCYAVWRLALSCCAKCISLLSYHTYGVWSATLSCRTSFCSDYELPHLALVYLQFIISLHMLNLSTLPILSPRTLLSPLSISLRQKLCSRLPRRVTGEEAHQRHSALSQHTGESSALLCSALIMMTLS